MTILYLHGFASGPASKKAQFFGEKLRAIGHEVIVPELDGGDFYSMTITSQLKIVEEVSRGRAVTVMGSSMGGYLAALHAASHPEVKQLVLLAPAFGFARRWPLTLGLKVVDQWRADGSMEMFHYGQNKLVRIGYQLLEDGLKYPDNPTFGQPALIFHGANDDTVPASFSVEFAKANSNVELHVWDSDHELVNVLEPMWQRVRSFLIQS